MAYPAPAMESLPPIQVYAGAILEALSELGGDGDVETINRLVAARVGLTAEQLAVPHGRGDRRSEFEYRAAWARTKLKKAGKIASVARSRWRLVLVDHLAQADGLTREGGD
jgi:hypothetical protein